jgi:hypothetical protein
MRSVSITKRSKNALRAADSAFGMRIGEGAKSSPGGEAEPWHVQDGSGKASLIANP